MYSFAPQPTGLSNDLLPPSAGAVAPPQPAAFGRGELKRKIYHVLGGTTAFAIRFLTPTATVIVVMSVLLWNTFIWRVLPRFGRSMWRPKERTKGMPSGIILYCVSVLVLSIAFFNREWMTATIWGVLAFGDGLATIVGRSTGGPRLPWNRNKGWYGSLAFVLFGTLGAASLIGWTLKVAFVAALPLAVTLALVCAVAESLPLPMDDNITVPLAGAIALPLLVMVPVLAL